MKNFDNRLRNFFKQWPNFYYFIGVVFGPMMFVGLSGKNFLKKYPTSGKKFNLGSGPRWLGRDVINVDIFPYKGVSLVADIVELPIPAASVSRVICDNVLEHVTEPEKVVSEIDRVLEPGGLAYFCNPFFYPFHASPNDFSRWTDAGFLRLLKKFEIVEKGVRAGIFSSLSMYLCYLLATLFSFGSKNLYWFLVNISIFLFFPVKLLDLIFYKLPFTENAAAVLYWVAKKK